MQDSLGAALDSLRNILRATQSALGANLAMARCRACLEGLDVSDIASMLFGEPAVRRIEQGVQ